MTSAQHIITGSFDYSLIILSAFLAVFVTYTILELARCILSTSRGQQRRWIVGAASVMGVGVWAAQFIGILSRTVPLQIDYNLRITTLALLISIISAAIIFNFSRQKTNNTRRFVITTISTVLLISGSLYLNLATLQTAATIHYQPALVILSILFISAAIAMLLYSMFTFRDGTRKSTFQIQLIAAVIIGLTLDASYYSAITSMQFTSHRPALALSNISNTPSLLALSIGTGVSLILWGTLLFLRWQAKESIKIADKISGLAFGLVFISVGIIGIASYSSSKELLIQKEFQSQLATLALETRLLKNIINNALKDAQTLARNTHTLDRSTETLWRERLAAIFSGFLHSKPHYLKVRYIDISDNGREIVSVIKKNNNILRTPEKNLAQAATEVFFIRAKNTLNYHAYLSNTYKNTHSNNNKKENWGDQTEKLILQAAALIQDNIHNDNRSLLGVVVIDIDLGAILTSIFEQKNNVQFFAEKQGKILLILNNDNDPFETKPDNKRESGTTHIQDIFPEMANILNAEKMYGHIISRHITGSVILSYRKMIFDGSRQQQYIKITTTPYKNITQNIFPALDKISIIALVLVGISTMLASIFSRVITQPLNQITLASRQFANGKTDFILPDDSAGEFGILAHAFRNMVAQVQERTEAAALSESFVRNLVDSTADGMVTVDAHGIIKSFNTAAQSIFGYSSVETINKNLTMLMPLRYRAGHENRLRRYTEQPESEIKPLRASVTGLRKNGEELPIELSINRFSSSTTPLFIGIVRDISQRESSETILRLANKLMESTPEGIVITDRDSVIVKVNPAFEAITGYSQNEVLGKKASLLKSGLHNNPFYQHMWTSILNHGIWQGEIWDKRKTGKIYPKWLSISAIKNDNNEITHFVGIFSDITERKEVEKRLEHLAHYDILTGLPNRALFHDRLSHSLEFSHRSNKGLAVMMLDLDRFKIINDTLGHDIGDMLLVEAAKRLKLCLRKVDTVARMGGDEFTVILSDISGSTDAVRIAKIIIKTLSKPFYLSGHNCFVGVSIGISLFPGDGETPQLLAKHADIAMYRVKDSGRNAYQLYNHAMGTQNSKRLDIESKLRVALKTNQLDLYYQPLIDIGTGNIYGMEALIRWYHRDIGMVPPNTFIPIAEESGLINDIGYWVLRKTCQQYRKWQSSDLDSISIMVNISAQQLLQPDFPQKIHNILEDSGMPPEKLTLEMTESTLLNFQIHTSPMLEKLVALGVRLSIDDFGTGYSSMGQLKKLPIHSIKIDNSFIRDIGDDKNGQEIVKAMIAMAHNFSLEVIAEGVETLEQLEFLKSLNCDAMQGFLYSPPLPQEAIRHLLALGAAPRLLT